MAFVASELQFVPFDGRNVALNETGTRTTMNVLFVSDTRFTQTPYRDASTRYRCYHMAEALQAAGYLADVVALDKLELVNLSRYDVVSVHQPSASRKLLSMLDRCNKLSVKTVADVDALEFEPALAEESPKSLLKNNSVVTSRAAFMCQRLALQHFDEVCVATEELARARRVQAPSQIVYVAANGLSNFWLKCNDKIGLSKPTNKRISYFAGNRSMETDFSSAADGISQFLKQTPNSEFNIVGPLDLGDSAIEQNQIIRSAWTDFMNMPGELVKSWVCVSPLSDTRINYAQPHTKFIESAAFGVPMVCSPTADLKYHDVAGLHLVETTEQWLQAFEALSDETYYASCQKDLYEYARDCCLATQSVQNLIERWSAHNEKSEDETFTTLSAAS